MVTSPADHIEVEWQYETTDTAAAARWFEASVVSGYVVTVGPTKEQHDTYFDTSDWRIHGAGYTCRIRRKKDGPEVTLKSMADSSGGMRSRREINEAAGSDSPDAIAACPGPAGELIRAIVGRQPIEPIFSLWTTRRIFNLADSDGPLAEIAVDTVVIPVEGQDTPATLSRVEVEVDATGVDRARRFVDLTVATLGLLPADTSKFQAGLAATGHVPQTEKRRFGPDRPTDVMTAGEAAFAIMRRQFATILANEPGTRLGEDIEALHDMRVATRRLRALMSAFRPYLPARTESYRVQFGRVAAALGEVRDLDVQLERFAEWRSEPAQDQDDPLAPVAAILEAHRVAARRRMLRVLDSRWYASLIERFSSFLQRGPARSFAPGRIAILAAAPDLLERRYRRVRRRGDAIRRTSPPADYHALRIDSKKLRYAVEFVGPLYGRPAIAFSERVTAVQDVLGLHQDAYVAMASFRELAIAYSRRLSPDTILAMGAIVERYRSDAERLRSKFPSAYRPLRGKDWRELRRVIENHRPPTPSPATNNTTRPPKVDTANPPSSTSD
ncbi:MAG TPA: CHAD domain-containing protein [Tepidiformaceae bacterium]